MEPLKPGSNTKAGGPAGSEPHPSNKPVSGGSTGRDLLPSDKLAQGDHDQEGEADKFGRGRTTRGRLAAGSLGAPRPTSPPPTAVQERPTLTLGMPSSLAGRDGGRDSATWLLLVLVS